MKKIPTLFRRDPDDMKRVLPELNVELPAECWPTAKWDGTAVMLDDEGRWGARREVKAGKTPPPGFREVDHDEVTGKRQGWVPIIEGDPQWKWHLQAIANYSAEVGGNVSAGTFEAVGPHFQGNPHNLAADTLAPHGVDLLGQFMVLNLDVLTEIMRASGYEGIVWWDDTGPVAKLKRRDVGLAWPS